MQIQPYLFLDGRAEEAIEFYKRVLGAKIEALMRFDEAPEQPPPGMIPPGSEKKVMHASIKIGEATVMISDGQVSGKPNFQGFSLTIVARDNAEADRLFSALSDGGKVTMPIGKTFFAERFGMVSDRFGVPWMVIAAPLGQ